MNRAVGKLIRDNKTFQLGSILQTGAAQGMALLDQSIAALVAEGSVTREEGLRAVSNPKVLGA